MADRSRVGVDALVTPKGNEVTLRAFGASVNLRGHDVIQFVCLLMMLGAVLALSWNSGVEHRAMAATVERTKKSVDAFREELVVLSFLTSLPESEKPKYRLMVPVSLRARLEKHQ